MRSTLLLTISVATALRSLVSFVLFPSNTPTDNGNLLSRTLGPGILEALGAAVLDPGHTWDHLQEACFWLEDNPAPWNGARTISAGAGYNAVYTPGTRIVAPPLVVAFLGETLVCPAGSRILRFIQQVLLIIADGIGAFCLYHLGMRVFEMEKRSNEEEIERHTKLSESNDLKCNEDLVVPGIIRPERGWVFGLSSKERAEVNEAPVNALDATESKRQLREGGKDYDDNDTKGATPPELQQNEPITPLDQLPIVAALSYFCNPVSMLANATGSIRSLWDAFLLISLYYATMPSSMMTKEGMPVKIRSATMTGFSLALATYADVGYAVFILPILLWRGMLQDTSTPAMRHRDWKYVLVLYLFHLGSMHFLASKLVGDGPNLYSSVIVQTILPDVAFIQQDSSGSLPRPSMGLHWYMFVQVFDRFRPYFTVFVSGIPSMLVVPLVTRLYRYPSILTAEFQLLWAIFRPTTTVHTLTLGIHLAVLNPRTIVRMRDPSLVSFFALPVPILLFVTFHRMWLVTGNGNPNYLYFQCFGYGLFATVIAMEFVSATVKRDKVRRMIENGSMAKLAKKDRAIAPQKENKKNGQQNGAHKEDQPLEESNGCVGKDSGKTDAMAKSEPVVVFL
ncbi:hypothetical protein ACHAWF_005437 [Thalassiosira exigua]